MYFPEGLSQSFPYFYTTSCDRSHPSTGGLVIPLSHEKVSV